MARYYDESKRLKAYEQEYDEEGEPKPHKRIDMERLRISKEEIFLPFADGTFIYGEPKADRYEAGNADIDFNANIDRYIARRLGFISDEEFNRLNLVDQRKKRETEEAHRKALFEKLKKEFEPKETPARDRLADLPSDPIIY